MGRPRLRPGRVETSERLLVAAARAFGEHGYEGATLEGIAKAVGIRRASLLHHFESKEALYGAVVDRAFDQLARATEQAVLCEGDFEARLHNLIDTLIDFEKEHLPLLSVLLRGALGQDRLSGSLVVKRFVPLVDRLEGFVRFGAGRELAEVPVRAALLQVIFGHFVRSSMGKAGDALWRDDPQTWTLARLLLMPDRARSPKPKAARGRV